jgi:AI-2 transport protein TqsA
LLCNPFFIITFCDRHQQTFRTFRIDLNLHQNASMGEPNINSEEKEQSQNIKVIKNILVIMVIPVIFYVLYLLPFIFVPLFSAVFLAILFTPLMRWFKRKKVHKIIALGAVILIILSFFKIGSELVGLSSREIMASDTDMLLEKMETKLLDVIEYGQSTFGMQPDSAENMQLSMTDSALHSQISTGSAGFFNQQKIHELFQNNQDPGVLLGYFGGTLNVIQKFITQVLMMFFFLLLFLSGSVDMERLMNSTVIRQRSVSIKTMLKIEKSVVKFIKVKFLLSAATGVGFTIACYAMDVSFPIFWGLFAFAINFVQMVGSVIAVLLCGLFALAEIDNTGTLMVFWLVITGVEVLFGGILEPIMMGKTFSINTVTVLVMLMLWGYIWGVPGLIMSIPITVVIKIILEQNPKTAGIAKVLS